MKTLILALSLAASAASAAADTPAERTQVINVATYNLRLNTPDDKANAWPHREALVKALIQYHELDLVATQEGLIEQITALESMPGWGRVGVGRDDGARGGEHAAIFYRKARFKVERHGDFWLSATPDKPSISWDSRCCNRLTTWAQMKDLITGRSFLVSSSHFDHEGEVSRRESARLLVARLPQLAGKLPVLAEGATGQNTDVATRAMPRPAASRPEVAAPGVSDGDATGPAASAPDATGPETSTETQRS